MTERLFPWTAETVELKRRYLTGLGPLLVGLTGGIASGKSTVSRMLTELGAELIDFDVLARRVVMPGQPAFLNIVDYFGPGVVAADGSLDRKRLGQVVFQDKAQLRVLESFTHPAIFAAFFKDLEQIAADRPDAVVQAAVPLLVEIGLCRLFEKVVLVYIPRELQMARLVRRDGIGPEVAARMIDAQMPIDEKRSFADIVIDNRGPLAETQKQTDAAWRAFEACQRRRPAGRYTATGP